MKPLSLSVCIIAALCSTNQAADVHQELEQAKRAQQILKRWQNDEPENKERFVHMVCWTPSDREFPEDYQTRLTRIMEHIQEFYRSEMERFGFDNHTIRLQYANQKLVLHTVRGKHPTDHYSGPSGSEIRKECLPTLKAAGIDPARETIVIMCNLATWDAKELRFTHKSPYYAGGSFRSGTAWQLDSPELDPQNLKLKMPIIRDGQYGRISLGKHNSIFIGGVAHELGHALGLPHCKQRPDEAFRGTALMGSGNRTYGDELRGEGLGSFLTLAHALRLASHPQFSGSVKGLDQTAEASMEHIDIVPDGKSIKVTGKVKGSPPIYAVVAYFDPEGGGDYNAPTATAVPDEHGRFSLSCDALVKGKPGELRLFPLHVNGSAAGQMSRTSFRYSYNVGRDGVPDLSTITIKKQLAPIVKALASRDRELAIQLMMKIESPSIKEIAAYLLIDSPPLLTPEQFAGDLTKVSLTSLKVHSAKVGWGRPVYNRVPNETMLMESGGRIFKFGIYAHAPATHTYQLGGKWDSISGSVGLAAGHRGSVQFEIKGDGQSLWKSSVIKTETQAFKVDVSGVQELELLTDPTQDGAASDWGLWLEPTLKRSSQ